MKKFTLFTFLFLLSMTFSFAQIPNPSFENWSTYTGGMFPTSWTSSDSVSGASHSAVQDIVDKCDGNYSVKLTTWSYLGIATVPGVTTNGLVNAGVSGISVTKGSPDQVRNDSLLGCYEYIPAGSGNMAIISVFLLKYNAGTGVRDTIAAAVWSPTAVTSPMTNFSIPFVYRDLDPSHLPDSILVILGSSLGINTAATVGSVLIVDNLSLKGILSGVIEPNAPFKSVKVYPQPAAGDVLHLDVTFGHYVKATYSVIDGLGRMVKTGNLKETQQVNIADLANGMYTLTLNSESGEQLYSTRVNVRR